MHASLIFPHYRDGGFSARGYPVRFVECPAVKVHNLSRQGLEIMKGLRDEFDRLGAEKRKLIIVVDGSLCNRTILLKALPHIEIVGRCRKDARLCFPHPSEGGASMAKNGFLLKRSDKTSRSPIRDAGFTLEVHGATSGTKRSVTSCGREGQDRVSSAFWWFPRNLTEPPSTPEGTTETRPIF